MSNLAAKMTTAYFDSKGIKYRVSGDNEEIVTVTYNADNKESVSVKLFFGKDNSDVAVRVFDICKYPKAKEELLYKVCSQTNREYRWIKFYCDEDDNTITAALDAVIQPDSCGEECRELVLRTVNIVDEVYPRFMKALWA